MAGILHKIKRSFFQSYYIFGDSHALVFNFLNKNYDLKPKFEVIAVIGATAVGLRNPQSMTNALPIFNKTISGVYNKKTWLLFLMGEIDTGYLIWYRAQKYGESIEKQMQESLSAYREFLVKLKKKGYVNLGIISAPLPTILDGQDWGEVAQLRKEVKATQAQRTQLTLRYNNELKKICIEEHFIYVDCDRYLYNTESKKIFDKFLNKVSTDHHMDDAAYSEVIFKSLIDASIIKT
jgi:hypothetical protein